MHCLLLDQIFFIFDFSRFNENDVIFIFRHPPPLLMLRIAEVVLAPARVLPRASPTGLSLPRGPRLHGILLCFQAAIGEAVRRVLRGECCFFLSVTTKLRISRLGIFEKGKLVGDGVESCDEYILGMVVATR